MPPFTRTKWSAIKEVCRPQRLLRFLEDSSGRITRSLARGLAIAKPEDKKAKEPKKPRASRIIARRQTTINAQPVQPARRERRCKSMNNNNPICYCICRGPDIGTLMVQCDDDACEIKWFHVSCLIEDIDLDLPWKCIFCR